MDAYSTNFLKRILLDYSDSPTNPEIFIPIIRQIKENYEMLDLIFSELTDKGVNVSCLFTDLNEMFKDKVMLYETTSSKNRHLIIDLPCSSKIKR